MDDESIIGRIIFYVIFGIMLVKLVIFLITMIRWLIMKIRKIIRARRMGIPLKQAIRNEIEISRRIRAQVRYENRYGRIGARRSVLPPVNVRPVAKTESWTVGMPADYDKRR